MTRNRPSGASRSFATLGLLWLGLASGLPASAEIYRWQDEAGREHFTQDLDSIPERHRPQAKARWEATGRRLNLTEGFDLRSTPPKSEPPPDDPMKGELVQPSYGRGLARPSPEDPTGPGGRSESAWRLGYRQHRAAVQQAHRHLAAVKALRRSQWTKSSKLARAELAVAKAEAGLEGYRERARRAGVPPGWLRDR